MNPRVLDLLLAIAGAALVIVGLAEIYRPAAWIGAGAAFIWLGLAAPGAK